MPLVIDGLDVDLNGVITIGGAPVTADDAISTLRNKRLEDSTTTIVDNTDVTRILRFDVTGTTGTTTTVLTSQTANRSITLPDATTTLVGRDTTDTLTNKTISGATNTLSNIAQSSILNLSTDLAARELLTNKRVNFTTIDNTGYPTTQAVSDFVNAQVTAATVGLLDDRGNHSAAGNTFPTTGGSGTAGAVLKGDLWTISVGGILGGVTVTPGDVIRALTDAPGQTATNWAIAENNFGYTAENQANRVTSFSSPTDAQYPSALLVSNQLNLKSNIGDSFFIGTTSIANNRASAAQTLNSVSISGNAATVTTNANLTGPITSVGNATSVTANAITNTMLAQAPATTLKGNAGASTANAADLTITQVRNMLGIKSGIIAGASFTGAPRIATVTFATPFPDANYSIAVTGTVGRTWTYQSKTATGFTINSNSNTAISTETSWTCVYQGS